MGDIRECEGEGERELGSWNRTPRRGFRTFRFREREGEGERRLKGLG